MKISMFLSICLLTLSLNAQSNEVKVNESGIQFGDGNEINDRLAVQTYPGTVKHIYADFSNSITGDIADTGYEGQVLIYSIDHFHYRDINPANGYPSSTARNKYFSFRKPVDNASVDLANTYKNNSFIDNITFNMVVGSSSGADFNRFDIELMDVKIVEYWLDFELTDGGNYQAVEKYLLAYDTFKIIDVVNNTSTSINWSY
jgi:type VI secretion system Hcp family effector